LKCALRFLSPCWSLCFIGSTSKNRTELNDWLCIISLPILEEPCQNFGKYTRRKPIPHQNGGHCVCGLCIQILQFVDTNVKIYYVDPSCEVLSA